MHIRRTKLLLSRDSRLKMSQERSQETRRKKQEREGNVEEGEEEVEVK